MKRRLHTLFAAGLALGIPACESETPAPAKTAKSDTKAEAKSETKPEAQAPPKDPGSDAEGDEEPEDVANADADADPPAEDDTPQDGGDDLQGYDPRVAKAARIASQISKEPLKADELLAAADLDRDKLDALMYEIANDPDLTAQYRVARGI